MYFYAHILIVSCLRATGVHNSWAPVKCVFVSVGAHSFMVSFFPFSGAHSLLVFFSLRLLVDTCCLVTVQYMHCLYTISQFKYAHSWSINHMYWVVERKQGNKNRKTKKKKILELKKFQLDIRLWGYFMLKWHITNNSSNNFLFIFIVFH